MVILVTFVSTQVTIVSNIQIIQPFWLKMLRQHYHKLLSKLQLINNQESYHQYALSNNIKIKTNIKQTCEKYVHSDINFKFKKRAMIYIELSINFPHNNQLKLHTIIYMYQLIHKTSQTIKCLTRLSVFWHLYKVLSILARMWLGPLLGKPI